jgi:hypothetical protein
MGDNKTGLIIVKLNRNSVSVYNPITNQTSVVRYNEIIPSWSENQKGMLGLNQDGAENDTRYTEDDIEVVPVMDIETQEHVGPENQNDFPWKDYPGKTI